MKNTALYLLPTFNLQLKDTNRILGIMIFSVMLCNGYLLHISSSWLITLIVSVCIFFGILAIFAYCYFLPPLLRSRILSDYYICAIIEFFLTTIAIMPVCLYLYVGLQWQLLNKYGIDCLFLFNEYVNWLMPALLFLMFGTTFWLSISNIWKSSLSYYQLENTKKEIYE